jgi:flagellar hook protein FlgE
MTKLHFDSAGQSVISYSNGQTLNGDRLALAWFSQPTQQLQRQGAGTYQVVGGAVPLIGQAATRVFGSIVGNKLELSNVELSAEFSEMIITQRGYQAASQLISAANEMMQQALQMKGGR